MEEKNQWTTSTIPKWHILSTAFYTLILGGAATLLAGLMKGWLYVYIVGALALAVLLVTVLVLKNRPPVILRFEEDALFIRNSNRKNYQVDAIPARDFVFRQNAYEKKRDIGRIRIKRSYFEFYGVQEFEKTRQYVQDNFPDR